MRTTKNRQTENSIRQMALAAFPKKQIKSYTELTEGTCNTAYRIEFTDGSSSVLKIATADESGRISNEVNIMLAEVKAMRIVHESNVVKVAEVQYYDDSRTLCSGDYFFMEELEGQSIISIEDQFTEEERAVINYEMGQAEKKITSIYGETFGLLGDEENCYDNLFDFFYQLIANLLMDAERKNVEVGVSSEEMLACLKQDKAIFDKIEKPSLVHWDMWEGNVFVKDKHVSGIIDWERAMWGDVLMDEHFRRHSRNQDFLRGYGQEEFTEEEMKRIYWYDILRYLTQMVEGAYRKYEDDGLYQWARPLFEASWSAIIE